MDCLSVPDFHLFRLFHTVHDEAEADFAEAKARLDHARSALTLLYHDFATRYDLHEGDTIDDHGRVTRQPRAEPDLSPSSEIPLQKR